MIQRYTLKQGHTMKRGRKSRSIGDLISREDWDVLFPNRLPSDGSGQWCEDEEPHDFYSYDNFIQAVREMAKIQCFFERRCATMYYRITRTDKETGEQVVIRDDPEFHAPWNEDRAIVSKTVDYGALATDGDIADCKRELAAFLANISHETTGGWEGAPGGRYVWGLRWKEELGYACQDESPYEIDHPLYPPTPDKSYHGRGPMQLSWNYNYGQCSAFLYADPQILLDAPERVSRDGVIAFKTAIWFWMTPQYPKPSCHDAIIPGRWEPTESDAERGLRPGFGATINIINGGLECGHQTDPPAVEDRVGFFRRYTERLGVDMNCDGEGGSDPIDCGCAGMGDFRVDYQECNKIASIRFESPFDGTSVGMDGLKQMSLRTMVTDPNNEVSGVTIQIEGETFHGEQALWTPPAYRAFTATATATIPGKDPATARTNFVVWNDRTFEGCGAIPLWEPKVYRTDPVSYIVQRLGGIYYNAWYAEPTHVPGEGDPSLNPWRLLGQCDEGRQHASSRLGKLGRRQPCARPQTSARPQPSAQPQHPRGGRRGG
jgi:hypothetical protein